MRGIGEILSGRLACRRCMRCWSIPACRCRPAPCSRRWQKPRRRAPLAIDGDPAMRLAEAAARPDRGALDPLSVRQRPRSRRPVPVSGRRRDLSSACDASPACRLARMRGSGGTCFGLFATATDGEGRRRSPATRSSRLVGAGHRAGSGRRSGSMRAARCRTRPSPPAPTSSATAETAPAHRWPSRRNGGRGRSYLPAHDACVISAIA